MCLGVGVWGGDGWREGGTLVAVKNLGAAWSQGQLTILYEYPSACMHVWVWGGGGGGAEGGEGWLMRTTLGQLSLEQPGGDS